jgi:hypothetical protein
MDSCRNGLTLATTFWVKNVFDYLPTQEEMKAIVLEGHSLLFIDGLKGK